MIAKRHILYILLILLCGWNLAFGASELYIERLSGGNSAIIGDILQFRVVINTRGEDVTGVAFFLTIDSDHLEPVLVDGAPFVHGSFLQTGYATVNDTHEDSLHKADNANGIPGFQLDYFQTTGLAVGGEQPASNGIGVIATFSLKVVGITNSNTIPATITFDDDQINNRETGYYLKDTPGLRQRFSPSPQIFEIFLSGIKFYPPIPDTLIAPGNPYTYDVLPHMQGDLTKGAYTWSLETLSPVSNAAATINGSILSITSDNTSAGFLDLRLIAGQTTTTYADTQDITVTLNHTPQFTGSLPDIEFTEDQGLTRTKSLFVNDINHSDSDLLFTSYSDNIIIQDLGDNIRFSAIPDWYGDEQVTITVQDPLQQIYGDSILTQLNVTVNSENDAPILNFDPFDNVTVFYNTPKQLAFLTGVHVTDDSENLTWSAVSSDTTLLHATFAGSFLTLTSRDIQYSGTVPVTITVEDDENLSDSEILQIQVEPVQVELLPFPELTYLPGSPVQLNLNDYVDYPQNQKDTLAWTFSAISQAEKTPDNNVILNYNNTAQTLEISAQANHQALDYLTIHVAVNDNNFDADTVNLRILTVNRLTVLDIPSQILIQNTRQEILDLDNYVIDPNDDPEDITWSASGGDSLADISIDTLTHQLTIETNGSFVGTDTLYCVATNTSQEKDSTALIVQCMVYSLYPIISPLLPDTAFDWKSTTPRFYVDLDSYVWDFNSPDSLIQWTTQYDTTALRISINNEHHVTIQTRDISGDSPVIFQATNEGGYTTSDTIIVNVKSAEPPEWRMIPSISMTNSEICSTLVLGNFCIDPGGYDLTYTSISSNPDVEITIDSLTSKVYITPENGYYGRSSMIFRAANEDTLATSNLIILDISKSTTISCMINPVADWHVHFLVTTDPTATALNYTFRVDSVQQTLQFSNMDSTSSQKVWRAPYQFSEGESYQLSIEVLHSNGIAVKDSLWIQTPVAKSIPMMIADAAGDLQLNISGPASNVYYLSKSGTHFYHNEQFIRQMYTVHGNFSEESAIELSCQPSGQTDIICYQIINNHVENIPTFKDETGRLFASPKENLPFFFAKGQEIFDARILNQKMLCYPNPFNSHLKMQIYLRKTQNINLNVYNILGQVVYSRAMDVAPAGLLSHGWEGQDLHGNPLPSGLYFIQLSGQNFKSVIRKVTLMR